MLSSAGNIGKTIRSLCFAGKLRYKLISYSVLEITEFTDHYAANHSSPLTFFSCLIIYHHRGNLVFGVEYTFY
jgi:hypothetical protein